MIAWSTPLWAMATGCKAPPSGPLPERPPPAAVSAPTVAELGRTEAFYDTRPAYERPLRETGVAGVEGVGSLSAAVCAACHPDVAAEWALSVHAQAWVDPQFQAEITKSDNRWLCLNCHTPLLVQQDRWPEGLVDGDVERPVLGDNPGFDPVLRDEGITCAACHVRNGVIHGPGLVETAGTAPEAAAHPVVADPEFRGADLCLRCHQAEASYPGKTFVCTFHTGEEWRAGPWDDEGETCVTCHMPAVTRAVAVGGPERASRRHWWRGAGIPKITGRYPPPEANPPGLALDARVDGGALVLTVTNAAAGHALPTGDPERWVQVDVTFTRGDAPVGAPWTLRIGQVWEWTAPPRKLSDDRLLPRASRTERIPLPAGADHATIEASSHRISAENAAYHGLTDYPTSVVTERRTLTW